MMYRYTSFFNSMLLVCEHLTTSENRGLTSLPMVMVAIIWLQQSTGQTVPRQPGQSPPQVLFLVITDTKRTFFMASFCRSVPSAEFKSFCQSTSSPVCVCSVSVRGCWGNTHMGGGWETREKKNQQQQQPAPFTRDEAWERGGGPRGPPDMMPLSTSSFFLSWRLGGCS